MFAERVVNVRLLDVNDNVPKLVESKAFVCVKKPEPVIITATDGDDPPFAQPFTFVLGSGKKSPNWDLSSVDGTELKKKIPGSGARVLIYVLSPRFHSQTHTEENSQ